MHHWAQVVAFSEKAALMPSESCWSHWAQKGELLKTGALLLSESNWSHRAQQVALLYVSIWLVKLSIASRTGPPCIWNRSDAETVSTRKRAPPPNLCAHAVQRLPPGAFARWAAHHKEFMGIHYHAPIAKMCVPWP